VLVSCLLIVLASSPISSRYSLSASNQTSAVEVKENGDSITSHVNACEISFVCSLDCHTTIESTITQLSKAMVEFMPEKELTDSWSEWCHWLEQNNTNLFPESNLIKLSNLMIDISIVEAVADYDLDVAKRVEYDYEIVDDGLLPLGRMAQMMDDTICTERPPIDVQRVGQSNMFRVMNGRHRVARAFLLGKDCVPVSRAHINRNTGHDDYVLAGGESNPGPVKKDRKRGEEEAQAAERRNNRRIADGINEYRSTAWYERAVKNGFKNKAALDRFNEIVRTRQDQIDPNRIPVCVDCGHSDVLLCDCCIVNLPGAVIIEDDVLIIPREVANVNYRFDWVNKVRRMFIWPKFVSTEKINHNIGWLSNGDLPEDMIWTEMLCYIRMKQNTTYKVNGVDDRAARLAHSKKIALQFLSNQKIREDQQLSPEFVNRVHYTVQKACDQVDDNFLFTQNNENHSLFHRVPWRICGRVGLAGLVLISPRLAAALGTALLTVLLKIWRQFSKADSLLVANGSVLVLRSILSQLKFTAGALSGAIWSGLVKPCFIATQQWLCKIAGIMWSSLCGSDIFARLPQLAIS